MVVMTSESYPFDFGQTSLICCVGASFQKSRTVCHEHKEEVYR